MSSSYAYVLEAGAARFLVAVELSETRFLMGCFEWLARHPQEAGVVSHRDQAGRTVQAHLMGRYTIAAWTDHGAREVRIVEVIED